MAISTDLNDVITDELVERGFDLNNRFAGPLTQTDYYKLDDVTVSLIYMWLDEEDDWSEPWIKAYKSGRPLIEIGRATEYGKALAMFRAALDA